MTIYEVDADVLFMLRKFQNDDFVAFKLLSFEICLFFIYLSFILTRLSLSKDLRIEDERLNVLMEMTKEKWDAGFYD